MSASNATAIATTSTAPVGSTPTSTLATAINSTLTTLAENITTTLVTTTATSTNATTTAATTTLSASAATTLSTLSSTAETLPAGDGDSHVLFLFCTVLMFVAVALVGKIAYSHHKKRRGFTMGTNRWSLPTVRGGSGSRLGAGIPMGGGLSGSASYRAMPQNSMDAPNPQARLDWERQFFDADDVAVPNALEDETHTSSRLQLNIG